ncbi:MAG: hypothetical protein ABR579_08315 [Actinomycetota bacterium]
MKKAIITALVLGLIAGSIAAPAYAKKPKKHKKPPPVATPVPVDANYYLHQNTCGDAAGDQTTMSTTDDTDAGTGCGAAEAGIITEIYEQTGVTPPDNPVQNSGPDTTTWTATDGIPFVLDGSKEIKGKIAISDFCCGDPVGASAGQATFVATVSGTTNGEVKEIGTATVSYLVTPNQYTTIVDFSIKPDASLDKASFTTLSLATTIRGETVLHGWYSLDDPSSFITVPTLQ